MANPCLRLLTFMCRIRAEIAEASLNKLAWQKRLSKVNRMISELVACCMVYSYRGSKVHFFPSESPVSDLKFLYGG